MLWNTGRWDDNLRISLKVVLEVGPLKNVPFLTRACLRHFLDCFGWEDGGPKVEVGHVPLEGLFVIKVAATSVVEKVLVLPNNQYSVAFDGVSRFEARVFVTQFSIFV